MTERLTIRGSIRGRWYRRKMRAAHRFGFCWPQKSGVEPGAVWCHWCGMRGRKPADLTNPAVRARIEAELSAEATRIKSSPPTASTEGRNGV